MDDIARWITSLDSADVAALATIVLVGVTAWYAKLTRDISKAARESADIAKESADIAKESSEAAKLSAEHAERAANTAERALLADVMPLVTARWSETIVEEPSMRFQLLNIGRSTALNIVLRFNDQDVQLQALGPGHTEQAFHYLHSDGPVTIEYGDAIGNRYKTVCSPSARGGRLMYETSLWAAGEWRLLKAM